MLTSLRHKWKIVALSVTLGLVTVPAAAAPALDWQPCDSGFFCATATVPLDYAHPGGATIQIAVIKHAATDPAHRIGSLFVNPGGPGGPGFAGVTVLPEVYARFPADVRARFDIVSFDPRGIGQSTDLQCFDTIDEENQLIARRPAGFPVTAAGDRSWETVAGLLDKACAEHAGPLLAHDTTADVARDMDRLRQDVGDPTMNYLGISYGSYLGATYANLFPGRVRAMTLDGAIDPVAWATGTDGSARVLGTFLRLGTDEASAAGVNAFLDLCGASTSCVFSAGSPAATHAKFAALLDRLAAHPVTLAGTIVDRQVAIGITALQVVNTELIPDVAIGWPNLAAVLQSLWMAAPGATVAPQARVPYTGREAQLGVVCSDSPYPRDPAEYPAQAAFATARSGVVGPVWAWGSEGCSQWPILAPQRYTGPWNHATAPILVVGTTGDAITPYRDAVAMSHDLAHARLLTVHGYGDATLFNHSGCADTIEGDYFVTGALPRPGTVCQQDHSPFAG